MSTVDTETRKSQEERKEEQKLRLEAQRLMALKDERVKEDDQTPCPSCTVYVPLQANTCSTCGSDIAASNALLRESLRRLKEIEAELDSRHRRQEDRSLANRSLGNRLKRLFSGSGSNPETDRHEPRIRSRVETLKPRVTGPRILDSVRPGQQITIIDHDDPWYLIRTPDGRTGWIFSTQMKDRT